MIDLSSLALLKGKKALVTGIANDQSIAWGCAKAFNAFGADIAITYHGEKTKRYVDPLAEKLEAPIYMPLDVQKPGELEATFEAIKKKWGKLDIVLHSIAFAPKADLQGRVVDCSKDGFLMAMELSCWSFIRMISRSSLSILTSVPLHLPNSTRSPGLRPVAISSPRSLRAPGPTAITSPCCGFSLAVSGMMMPPAVFSSASTRRTSTRSWSGRNFIRSPFSTGNE